MQSIPTGNNWQRATTRQWRPFSAAGNRLELRVGTTPSAQRIGLWVNARCCLRGPVFTSMPGPLPFPLCFAGGSYERTDDGSHCGSMMRGGPGGNLVTPLLLFYCIPAESIQHTYIQTMVRVSEIGLTVKGESPAARLSTHRNPYLRCTATEPLGCRPTNDGCRCCPRRRSAKRAGSVRRRRAIIGGERESDDADAHHSARCVRVGRDHPCHSDRGIHRRDEECYNTGHEVGHSCRP